MGAGAGGAAVGGAGHRVAHAAAVCVRAQEGRVRPVRSGRGGAASSGVQGCGGDRREGVGGGGGDDEAVVLGADEGGVAQARAEPKLIRQHRWHNVGISRQ